MNDDMTISDEDGEKLIGKPIEELPSNITDMFDAFGACPECGEQAISFAPDPIDSTKVCWACEAELGTEDEVEIETEEEGVEESTEKTREEAKNDATRNTGKMFQMIGLLFTLTLVGAIVGIPLLILGMHIEAKNIDDDN